MCEAINELLHIENFDCHKIDTVYLSNEMREYLPYLQAIKLESIRLSDVICCAWGKERKLLPESCGAKVASGAIHSGIITNDSLHIGQTD